MPGHNPESEYETPSTSDRSARRKRRLDQTWRAVIEIAFIIFLFYSNLLMGEFTAANGRGKSLALALGNILTRTDFLIAMVSAIIGYLIVEYLRKRL